MPRIRFIGIWLIVFSSVKLFAQYDTIPIIEGIILEEYAEQNEEESFDFNTLFEDVEYYLKNPLDLNKATEAQLRELQILNDIQLNDFLNYRTDYGPFLSIYELQAIPSFDIQTVRTIIDFVNVDGGSIIKKLNVRTAFQEGSSNVFLKWKRVLEDRRGYDTTRTSSPYLGDPNHLYMRYRFNYGQVFKMGFTAEKDAGESFFKGSNPSGFDYYSAFVYGRDINRYLKVLSLGDYTVSMGQGLILHNGFGSGKSSYVMNIKKGGYTIRPYSSVNEVNFFRGAAATLGFNDHWEFSVFGSIKKIDGTLSQDTLIENGFTSFGSIILDGYHRTQNEIDKENTVTQRNAGFNLIYRKRNIKVGLNGLSTNFSEPLDRDFQLYRSFQFNGDQLTNVSLDYSYRFQNFNFFGEIARSDNDGMAQMHGLLLGLNRNMDLSIVYRNYGRDYQVLSGNAFAEASSPVNEKGIYLGIELRPINHFRISTYFDFWKNPWLKFRVDAPGYGREFLTKVEYNLKRRLNAYIQYKFEEKNLNSNDPEDKIDGIGTTQLQRLRLHLSHKVTKSVELRNRAEFSWFDRDGTQAKGFLVYQDVIVKPQNSRLSLTARYSLFDTETFDTRIYTYENDILYEFAIPFFQNAGSRYYANLRYNLSRNMTVEFRYAKTHYTNIDVIGSSGEEILGSNRTELKAQLKIKF